ncbi:MAG: CHAP domain-containing protein [Bacteroidota bacterium]
MKPGYAWCAAFCHWSFSACHAPRMRSAWAPAWFPDDKVIYRRGSKVNGVPLPGDLAGFAWNGGRIAHIGIIEQWSESSAAIITIEGNTNNAGSREGDGVYRKRRPKSQVSLVADWIGRYVPG